jgi:hypothetical protein
LAKKASNTGITAWPPGSRRKRMADVGETALTYQEVKALATGNPLLLDQAKAEAELARLERLDRAHARNQVQLRGSIRHNEAEIERLDEVLAATDVAIARRRDTRGDAFAMTVDGRPTTKRPEAEARLQAATLAQVSSGRMPDGVPATVGSLGGFPVLVTVRRPPSTDIVIALSLDGVPESEVRLTVAQLAATALVTRLENRLSGLEHLREGTAAKVVMLRGEVAKAAEMLAKPFLHSDRLAAARARVHEISQELEKIANRTPENTPAPVEAGPASGPVHEECGDHGRAGHKPASGAWPDARTRGTELAGTRAAQRLADERRRNGQLREEAIELEAER